MALVIVENPNEVLDTAALKSLGEQYLHFRFPLKVWRLASETTFEPIKWSEDGKSLIINEVALEPTLGYFFRSVKFSSFLRQLHLYGFRKMAKTRSFKKLPNRSGKPKKSEQDSLDSIAEYAAKDFERDRPDLIDEVRRFYGNASRGKKNRSSSPESASSSQEQPANQMSMLSPSAQEHHKQLMVEHAYHLSDAEKKSHQSHQPSPPNAHTPILNPPLPPPYTDQIAASISPRQPHPGFMFPFQPIPLFYSPSTGTYSMPPGFSENLASLGYPPQFSNYQSSALMNAVDQSSRDSGISDTSSSSIDSSSTNDGPSYFHLMDPVQSCALAYYPFSMMMPAANTAAPH